MKEICSVCSHQCVIWFGLVEMDRKFFTCCFLRSTAPGTYHAVPVNGSGNVYFLIVSFCQAFIEVFTAAAICQ